MTGHDLRTFPSGLWVLQSLLGLESMPISLRLAHYIPSGCAHIPVATYPEYHSLVQAGVIDEAGRVDPVVVDWLTVISRPDLEVQLTIRRPGPEPQTVTETVTVLCRMECWIAGITRTPATPERREQVAREIDFAGDPATLPPEWVDEIRVFPVAEVSDATAQCEAIATAIVAELGEYAPADIEGLNVEFDTFLHASGTAAGDPDVFTDLLGRQGISARQIGVLNEAMALDRSALAVISARHVWPGTSPEERAVARTVSIADSAAGRISMSQSVSQDGKWWLSVWPGHSSTVRADIAELVAGVIATPAPAR
jgi:EspG family